MKSNPNRECIVAAALRLRPGAAAGGAHAFTVRPRWALEALR